MAFGMGILEIIVVVAVVGFVALVFVVWLLLNMVFGGSSSSGRVSENDQRAMQELHADLTRMEKRLEALETILCEAERKD